MELLWSYHALELLWSYYGAIMRYYGVIMEL